MHEQVVAYIEKASASQKAKDSVVPEEIGNLVHAFISIRAVVIHRNSPNVPTLADREESQDEYGGFDIDPDDPELAAILGDQLACAGGGDTPDAELSKVGFFPMPRPFHNRLTFQDHGQ